ncbi:hypothetical protein BGZ73_006869, partial [Actinomortierella ambigua]
ALREIESSIERLDESSKPLITLISTTGVSQGKEDVPFGFQTLYHKILAVPHAQADCSQRVFRGTVVVRPSLLTGDHRIKSKSRKDIQALKVGSEDKPAIGYTVHRADVDEWIYERVVRPDASSFVGQKVTLTN